MSIARERMTLQLDEDIRPELIKSKIIGQLLNEYHSFVDNGEYYFVNAGNSMFMGWIDTESEYRADISDVLKDVDLGGTYKPLPKMSVVVPTLRIIYVCKSNRGHGLQKKTFDRIIEISEATGEVFGCFSDPLIINNGGGLRETNAREALIKLVTNHYSEPPDWKEQLVKQRSRFLSYGLRNCKYEDARITHPCQSFLYCPNSADDETKELVDRLEVFYEERT